MPRKRTKTLLVSACLFALNASQSYAATDSANVGKGLAPIDNPIVIQRADPMLVRNEETGCYTFIGSSPAFDEIALRQACSLNDLKTAESKVIWKKHASGPMSENIWAPELHQVDGSWYIYFAAGDKAKPFSIRMYALKNESADPLQGEWKEMGRIHTGWDTFSLDATVFEHNGKHYYAWAQQDRAQSYNSGIWIAEMTSPTELKLPAVLLTEPTEDWEQAGYKVNEGPAIIKHGDKVFMTYSGGATDHRYAMGLLWADTDADLLKAKSWTKLPEPIFTTDATLGRYGPGHNSFVKAEDGKTDLLIYHSRDYRDLRGTPLTDPNRHARARVIRWDENGFPDLQPEKVD